MYQRFRHHGSSYKNIKQRRQRNIVSHPRYYENPIMLLQFKVNTCGISKIHSGESVIIVSACMLPDVMINKIAIVVRRGAYIVD
jgi:hypothetical protein